MNVRVVQKKLNDRNGIVTIEADTQEAVLSAAARRLAIETAASTIPRAGTSGGESPYPVDANGVASEDLMLGKVPVVAYRCDYQITGGL